MVVFPARRGNIKVQSLFGPSWKKQKFQSKSFRTIVLRRGAMTPLHAVRATPPDRRWHRPVYGAREAHMAFAVCWPNLFFFRRRLQLLWRTQNATRDASLERKRSVWCSRQLFDFFLIGRRIFPEEFFFFLFLSWRQWRVKQVQAVKQCERTTSSVLLLCVWPFD